MAAGSFMAGVTEVTLTTIMLLPKLSQASTLFKFTSRRFLGPDGVFSNIPGLRSTTSCREAPQSLTL